MARPSQVILLVEDNLHQRLITGYLRELRLGAHAWRILKSPSGRGSAEAWVRKHFADQVRACRDRQARTQLVVVLDADSQTVKQRIGLLDQALHDAGTSPVDKSVDEIARLIPKRNIETWGSLP